MGSNPTQSSFFEKKGLFWMLLNRGPLMSPCTVADTHVPKLTFQCYPEVLSDDCNPTSLDVGTSDSLLLHLKKYDICIESN